MKLPSNKHIVKEKLQEWYNEGCLKCPDCNGSGWRWNKDINEHINCRIKCETCMGTGAIKPIKENEPICKCGNEAVHNTKFGWYCNDCFYTELYGGE